jgi:hypothetical protein
MSPHHPPNPSHPPSKDNDDQILESPTDNDLRVERNKYEADENGAIPVFFDREDPENPQTGWATTKRWRVLFVALFVTFTSACKQENFADWPARFGPSSFSGSLARLL